MIELKHISKWYQTGSSPTFILKDINLSIGEGEFVLAAGDEDAVQEIEVVLFVRETAQGCFGFEVEAESAFGTWFADASEDSGEGLALEVAGELFEFAFGERGE